MPTENACEHQRSTALLVCIIDPALALKNLSTQQRHVPCSLDGGVPQRMGTSFLALGRSFSLMARNNASTCCCLSTFFQNGGMKNAVDPPRNARLQFSVKEVRKS